MRSFWGLLRAYWVSDHWKEAWLLTFAVAALTAAASKSGVWVAEASGNFIAALAAFPDTPIADATSIVLESAATLVGLAALKLSVFIGLRHYFATTLHRKWRAWMDHQFNTALLNDRRAYYHLMAMGTPIDDQPSNVPDNIDQRIQDSIKATTGNTLGMAMGLFSVVTSVFFVGQKLLETSVPVAGLEFLGAYASVALVLLLAATYVPLSTLIALRIGRLMEGLSKSMQKYEGSYRAELAMLMRRVLPVAAAGGEYVQARIHAREYEAIDRTWASQNKVSAAFLSFNQLYNFLTDKVVSYVALLPAYMQGALTFRNYVTGSELVGELINSCSWLIQVMPDIANLRANATRVIELAEAIDRVQDSQEFYRETGVSEFRYEWQPAELGITVQSLELMFAGRDTSPFLRVAKFTIRPGQWVFVRGPSGSGKSCLIKAMNGLWPYGRGRIAMPLGASQLYACQDTRLPQASLKQLVCIPHNEKAHRDVDVAGVLGAVGLGEFIEGMGEMYHHGRRWDDVLSGGQKQKVVLARILLHRPDVLFLDEATAALDPDARTEFHKLIKQRCPNAIVIAVMHEPHPPTDALGRSFYNAILNIEHGRAGLEPVIVPVREAARPLPAQAGARPAVAVMRNRLF